MPRFGVDGRWGESMPKLMWAKQQVRRLGVRWPVRRWVVAADNPAQPDVVRSFGFFAILGTWMEGDVIEATVKNAYAQGCDRVYLVDNASLDDTVEAACREGAELARTFVTDQYDEPLRIRLMNEVVATVSAEAGLRYIWWLWLDADEFPHGPDGLTLREFIGSLDRRFRLVGSRYFNHFPDGTPECLVGFHPLDLQPLCEELVGTRCASGHRKHQLQRYDRDGPPIRVRNGFHQVESKGTLIEPSQSIFTHHFPYRQEALTRRRLELLCQPSEADVRRVELYDRHVRRRRGTASDIARRHETVDRVYAHEWSLVDGLNPLAPIGIAPRPWADVVEPEHVPSARWYAATELEAAVAEWQASSTMPGPQRG
jgi:hypothetical protein